MPRNRLLVLPLRLCSFCLWLFFVPLLPAFADAPPSSRPMTTSSPPTAPEHRPPSTSSPTVASPSPLLPSPQRTADLPASPLPSTPPLPSTFPSAPPPPSPSTQGVAWDTVPLTKEQGLQGQGKIEIRGWLIYPKGSKGPTDTGLLRYRGQERLPLARLRSSPQGFFRYQASPQKGDNLRIALLHHDRFLEYPVPRADQREGVIYLRIRLPEGLAPTSASQGHEARQAPSSQASQTSRSSQTSQASPPPPPLHPSRSPQTPQDSLPLGYRTGRWGDVPTAFAPKAPKQGGYEIRGRVLLEDGQPAPDMPTGLLVKRGEQRLPFSRVRADQKGRFRYIVAPDPSTQYEVAILYGSNLQIRAVPLFQNADVPAMIEIKMPLKTIETILYEGFNLLVQPADRGHVEVTHIIALSYHPSPSSVVVGGPTFSLPLPEGATEIRLGQEFTSQKIRLAPQTIHVQQDLKPGRNPFLYSYKLPYTAGIANLSFQAAYPIGWLSIYLPLHYELSEPPPKSEVVKLGEGKEQRTLRMYRFPSIPKGGSFKALVGVPGAHPKHAFFSWLARWKAEPTKRNKLVGLALLCLLSFFGVFFLLAAPPPLKEGDAKSA